MTGMTQLTQALALSKSTTEPTEHAPCEKFRQAACTGDDGPCDDCKGFCVCGFSYAEHLRGFGSNVAYLAPGMKRVPRA